MNNWGIVKGIRELLGQDRVAASLLQAFEGRDTRLVRLTGPSGSGKSHIAFGAGATWRESGGGCVVAAGDGNHAARSLHPFLSGLASLPRSWAGPASHATRSALHLAGMATGTGSVGSSVFDLLTSAFRQRVERALRPFSSVERGIILDLTRISRSERLLLIADNAHWWDASSLWLLREIVSDRLREAVPQLGSVVVLLVDSADDQHPSAPDEFTPLTAMCSERTWRTSRCTRQQFPRVLQSFGLQQDLPEDVLDALFSATGGHLKLAEQLAAYAEHHGLRRLSESRDSRYLATLLATRIESLGASSGAMISLLGRAAVIGLSFEDKELLCLADDIDDHVLDLIDRAESISFLQREGSRLSFSHDVVRSAILQDHPPNLLRDHRRRFEECLSLLRPGDYEARAEILRQAGERERSRELSALAAVAQLRRGVPAPRVLRDSLHLSPDDTDLHSFLEMMAAAYDSVALGDYKQPLPRLKAPVTRESTLMAAERNYLAALCSMELETAPGVDEARRILTSWQPDIRAELELRLRFLLLLQQAQVLSERFDDARETERRIERQLLARVPYDPDAAVMLQVQNRRSSALNVPEVAELRIKESVSFFRRGAGDATRDRRELFRALNNLVAVQVRLGRDAEAYASVRDAEQVVLEGPETIARLDVLASNAVLAGMRSGAINLVEAVDRQRVITESEEGSDDKFIHRCNLAAYQLLLSRDEEARSELEALGDALRGNEFGETYLVYYWSALDVAATVLAGELDRALGKHAAMEEFVRSLKWPAAPYIRRRHELLESRLHTVAPERDRASADNVLLADRPSEVGPAWSYYARLVPCCELSFWSES